MRFKSVRRNFIHTQIRLEYNFSFYIKKNKKEKKREWGNPYLIYHAIYLSSKWKSTKNCGRDEKANQSFMSVSRKQSLTRIWKWDDTYFVHLSLSLKRIRFCKLLKSWVKDLKSRISNEESQTVSCLLKKEENTNPVLKTLWRWL